MTKIETIKELQSQINEYESMILYNRDFEPKNDNTNLEKKMNSAKMAIKALEEVQEYRKLGTVEEVREAVEKQKPKKPIIGGNVYTIGDIPCDTWWCPNCERRYKLSYDNYKYCPECGNKIDWSVE